MPTEILTAAIDDVASGRDLPAERAEAVLSEIMEGRGSEIQAGAFLVGLRAKGETVEELIGLARAMRSLATPVRGSRPDLVDTCGTGGGPSTFNVSTVAGLVAAAAGCAVAKHGNRSSTSRSGSADLLEALGVDLELSPEEVARCIDELGFGFMFAPRHHSAMANVIRVRRELAVRTAFNFLGPLTNPAGARRQLVGISDSGFQETVAEALQGLGAERAWVVSADDGMDELAIDVPTRVIEVDGDRISDWILDPALIDLGSGGGGASAGAGDGRQRPRPGSISGGEPDDNAALARSVLAGEPGPARDLTVLNAAAAIHLAGRAGDLAEGIVRANEAIDSGSASSLLERLAAATGAAGAAEPS